MTFATAGHRVAHEAPTRQDRLRHVTVLVSEILCIVGTLVGMGVLGTRVQESSGGSLAADATLIAPGSPAFSIWSVIYLGLAAYTVWQLLPANATHPAARSTGWLAAASMLLNAAWLLVTQVGWLWVSVVVIVALLVVLGLLIRRLHDGPRGGDPGIGERVVLDGTFGLYLGWVSVAVCANITATLVASGVRFQPPLDEIAAVVLLAAVALVGVVLARRFGGRLAVAVAVAWGLGWIAWARLADAPSSTVTGIAAVVAAVVVLASALVARRSRPGVSSSRSRAPHPSTA